MSLKLLYFTFPGIYKCKIIILMHKVENNNYTEDIKSSMSHRFWGHWEMNFKIKFIILKLKYFIVFNPLFCRKSTKHAIIRLHKGFRNIYLLNSEWWTIIWRLPLTCISKHYKSVSNSKVSLKIKTINLLSDSIVEPNTN